MPRWAEQWDVPSSDGSIEYKVSICEQGTWACSCRAWTTRVPRRDCKHIKAIKIVQDHMNEPLTPQPRRGSQKKPTMIRKIII